MCGSEIWKPVTGFDALYEVSDLGRVRSIRNGKFLSPEVGKNGYLRIKFCNTGKQERRLLHRVVLEAFVGECPAGYECRHRDGKRGNCALSNLVWGTRSENAIDRVNHGTHVNNKGERHGMTNLTDEQAKEILILRKSGVPLAQVAAKFSIGVSTVSQIANGKTWKHITEELES